MWLGWLWIPLRPLLQLVSRAFLFGGLLGVGSGDRPYLIFLMVGQASWNLFDRTVYFSYRGLRMQRRFIETAPIPWAMAVASTVIAAVVDAIPLVAICVVASCYYKITQGSFYVSVSPTGAVKLLFGIALLGAWGIAVALITAPLMMVVRDLRFLITYVIQFIYFVTPVLYAASSVPEKYRMFAILNPITAPIEIVKDNLIQTGAPSMKSVVASFIGLAILLPFGLLLCSHLERKAHERL
jgi:lipopolysaccharide transport system permease protein